MQVLRINLYNKNATRKQKHLLKKYLDCPKRTKRSIRNKVNVNKIEQIETLNKTDESQFVYRPGHILINSLIINNLYFQESSDH